MNRTEQIFEDFWETVWEIAGKPPEGISAIHAAKLLRISNEIRAEVWDEGWNEATNGEGEPGPNPYRDDIDA